MTPAAAERNRRAEDITEVIVVRRGGTISNI
jgi:hypothetical protein